MKERVGGGTPEAVMNRPTETYTDRRRETANDLNIKLPPTFSIYFDYIRISTVNLLTGEVSVTYRGDLILKHDIYSNIVYVYMTDYKWWKDDLPGKIRDFMENKLEPNIDKFITILMLYP